MSHAGRSTAHLAGKVPGIVFDKGVDAESIPGVARVALPIGVNAIESVNMYVLADGDKVTVVDCGVWRPDLPDGGLADMEAGLESAGYALGDVSRVIVTHAHIDHYGLAGRVMELTGADLSMHAMTDLDCEKYRHPDTARARRRDTYADHGIPEDERGDLAEHLTRWMPYLYSVVEASTRLRGDRAAPDRWRRMGSHPHSGAFPRPHLPLVAGPCSCCCPAITCCRASPRRSPSSADSTPTRCAATCSRLRAVKDRRPHLVYPGHGRPFGDAVGRIEAIMRNKARRMHRIRSAIADGPCTVGALTDRLVAGAILAHQRQLAINETLAHIAYLRYSGLIERRIRPDGVYEWFSTSSAPLDVDALIAL